MKLTIKNDTAFHEAGHCIMAYLAADILETKNVTANKNVSQTQDITSLGGLSGSIIKDVNTLTFEDHDLMVLVFFAGMAADDVNQCNCQLTEQLYDNLVVIEKMNSNEYSGDCFKMRPHLQRVIPQLSINHIQYFISCQRLLHEIFTTNIITPILINLRNLIETSLNQTLFNPEIQSFFNKSELKNWRENEWKEIMAKRIAKIKKSQLPTNS